MDLAWVKIGHQWTKVCFMLININILDMLSYYVFGSQWIITCCLFLIFNFKYYFSLIVTFIVTSKFLFLVFFWLFFNLCRNLSLLLQYHTYSTTVITQFSTTIVVHFGGCLLRIVSFFLWVHFHRSWILSMWTFWYFLMQISI